MSSLEEAIKALAPQWRIERSYAHTADGPFVGPDGPKVAIRLPNGSVHIQPACTKIIYDHVTVRSSLGLYVLENPMRHDCTDEDVSENAVGAFYLHFTDIVWMAPYGKRYGDWVEDHGDIYSATDAWREWMEVQRTVKNLRAFFGRTTFTRLLKLARTDEGLEK